MNSLALAPLPSPSPAPAPAPAPAPVPAPAAAWRHRSISRTFKAQHRIVSLKTPPFVTLSLCVYVIDNYVEEHSFEAQHRIVSLKTPPFFTPNFCVYKTTIHKRILRVDTSKLLRLSNWICVYIIDIYTEEHYLCSEDSSVFHTLCVYL